MQASPQRFGESDQPRAFSLIEMLSVIAVIVLLMSVVTPVIKGVSGGSSLSNGGNAVAGLMESARSNAILRKRPTAVVMIVGSQDGAYRAMCAVEYVPASEKNNAGDPDWKQLTKWYVLPEGLTVDGGRDADGNPATTFTTSSTVNPPLPSGSGGLSFRGRSLGSGDFVFQVFLEDGRWLRSGNASTTLPCKMRIVEGYYENNEVRLTGARGDMGQPANYYGIVINEATGQTKIERPTL